jgi:hypothetical protein
MPKLTTIWRTMMRSKIKAKPRINPRKRRRRRSRLTAGRPALRGREVGGDRVNPQVAVAAAG